VGAGAGPERTPVTVVVRLSASDAAVCPDTDGNPAESASMNLRGVGSRVG
jgi:hypothetical protein